MQRKGKDVNFDPQVCASNSYSDLAGAQKNVSVGAKLIPIKLSETSYTTDGTVARSVQKGAQLAIYNNSGLAASINFGKTSAVSLLSAGATDSDGYVGIILKPNDWNYVAVGEDSWFISSASTALIYIVDDHTLIK